MIEEFRGKLKYLDEIGDEPWQDHSEHNITDWLFLDTEGENRLYSDPKKREFLSPSPTQRPRWKLPPPMPPPT